MRACACVHLCGYVTACVCARWRGAHALACAHTHARACVFASHLHEIRDRVRRVYAVRERKCANLTTAELRAAAAPIDLDRVRMHTCAVRAWVRVETCRSAPRQNAPAVCGWASRPSRDPAGDCCAGAAADRVMLWTINRNMNMPRRVSTYAVKRSSSTFAVYR